jgi:hypothetical protein
MLGMVGGVFLEVEVMGQADVVVGMEDEAEDEENFMTGGYIVNIRILQEMIRRIPNFKIWQQALIKCEILL